MAPAGDEQPQQPDQEMQEEEEVIVRGAISQTHTHTHCAGRECRPWGADPPACLPPPHPALRGCGGEEEEEAEAEESSEDGDDEDSEGSEEGSGGSSEEEEERPRAKRKFEAPPPREMPARATRGQRLGNLMATEESDDEFRCAAGASWLPLLGCKQHAALLAPRSRPRPLLPRLGAHIHTPPLQYDLHSTEMATGLRKL